MCQYSSGVSSRAYASVNGFRTNTEPKAMANTATLATSPPQSSNHRWVAGDANATTTTSAEK